MPTFEIFYEFNEFLGASGSGLAFKYNGVWTLRGVVSYMNKSLVFTDVAQVSNWISGIVNEYHPVSVETTTVTITTTTTKLPSVVIIE